MKLFKAFKVRRRLPVLLGCFLLVILAAISVSAQDIYSRRVIDPRSPLSQDITELISQLCPDIRLDDIEYITRDIQLAADGYSMEPSLVLALMRVEDSYQGYPQTRLYYFNLDMGLLVDEASFPRAWYDAERVARSYYVEYERYEDKAKAVAAYFVGSRALPSNGDISNQPQEILDHVSNVLTLDAEWSHLGERGGPQIVTPDENTPDTSFELIEYDFSEIEQGYIQNMMYFNPNLDEQTAQEIFQAIHQHAADYRAVDARLVMALVARESRFKPDAVSRCGAQGLGQLMPFTSERFGVNDPFDVSENIRATFAYLDRELERWADHNYTIDRVLAAYNAGPNAVEQYTDPPYNGIPPYQETVNYVPLVINVYFYLLPEEERGETLIGNTRYVTEANGVVQLAQ